MMKAPFLLLRLSLVVTCLLICSSPLYGQKQLVRVGLFDNKPMCYSDSGKPAGVFIEVLDYVARQEGWELQYVEGTWKELRQKLSSGEIDIVPSMAVSAERQKIYAFNTLDIFTNWGEIYVAANSNIHTFFDLEGKKVAALDKGIFTTGPEGILKLKDIYGVRSEVLLFPSYLEAMQAVQQGKADAAVVNRLVGAMHGGELGLHKSGIVFAPVKVRFGFNRDNPNTPTLVATIDRHFQVLRDDDTSAYHRTLAGILGGHVNEFTVPAWLLYGFFAFIFIILLLASFVFILRRQVEQRTKAFMASEGRFQDFAENCLDWLWEFDENDRFTYVSPRIKDLLGYRPEEVIGISAFDLIPSPEKEKVREEFQEVKEARQSFNLLENVNQHKDGHLVTLESSGVPIIGPDGEFKGYRGVDRDISERKAMEAKLCQAQRVEAIGTLAGGIAHDFNNILTAIFGYAELAKLKVAENVALNEELDQILQGARRARDLVTQILTFSRQSKQARQTVLVATVVKEVLKFLRPSIPTTIAIKAEIASAAMINADLSEIHQLIMNLCTNAYHAMEQAGGLLTINLQDTALGKDAFVGGQKLAAGRYVVLSVSDTGQGITAENLEKIFEPYFTTKDKGRGTGLGLAVVHGIVRSHCGAIEVTSQPGKGSCFTVYLPAMELGKERQTLPDGDEELPGGHGERILVVDDEEDLRTVVSLLLGRAGYQVEVCTNAQEALDLLAAKSGSFDLLFTDMTMPGMTGKELGAKVMELYPLLPIIVCTGYSSLLSPAQAKEFGFDGFLQKPLSRSELLKYVRQVLDQQQGRAAGGAW